MALFHVAHFYIYFIYFLDFVKVVAAKKNVKEEKYTELCDLN